MILPDLKYELCSALGILSLDGLDRGTLSPSPRPGLCAQSKKTVVH
jgi:hypothetical protein